MTFWTHSMKEKQYQECRSKASWSKKACYRFRTISKRHFQAGFPVAFDQKKWHRCMKMARKLKNSSFPNKTHSALQMSNDFFRTWWQSNKIHSQTYTIFGHLQTQRMSMGCLQRWNRRIQISGCSRTCKTCHCLPRTKCHLSLLTWTWFKNSCGILIY